MSDLHATDVAPAWTWAVTAGSAALAVLSALVGGSATAPVTTGLAVVAGVGTVYLLYRWGQRRERSPGSDDGDGRRRKEMEAEKGGYGGSGGG